MSDTIDGLDLSYMQGILASIADHIAVEQTCRRLNSEETVLRATYLRQILASCSLTWWSIINEHEDPYAIVKNISKLAGDNIDPALAAHLPYIAGYAIGGACAGYTPLVLTSNINALDVRTAEFWMARKLIIPAELTEGADLDTEVSLEYVDVRLSDIAAETGTILRLRWSTDEDCEDTWLTIKGPALPYGFTTPVFDLQAIRDSFERGVMQ